MIKTQKGQNFIKGAAILTASTIIVKLIGAFFKIPLTYIIGTSGMGYFSTSYNIFNIMYVIASAALPSAVAKLVSSNIALGRHKDADRIIKIAFSTYSVAGLVLSLLAFFGSGFFAMLFSNNKAANAIMVIAPAIFLITIVATYKGFFQGNHNMVPTSFSNIIEAITQLVMGLGISFILKSQGLPLPVVAAGAVSGVPLGAFLSALYMSTLYKKTKKFRMRKSLEDTSKATPTKRLYREFLKISIPITIGGITLNLANFIDAIFVMNRLNSLPGYNQEIANHQYGIYTSMAVTLFNMPASVIMSFGISALPMVAAAFAVKNKAKVKSNINSALRVCSMFAMPAAIGMSVMSSPILHLLFFKKDLKADIGTGTTLLSILGIAVIFVCMSQITQSMLQAIGKPTLPVINVAIGGAVKVITNIILVGTPGIGIFGAPIGTNISYFVIMSLNLAALYKCSGVFPNIMTVFLKPLISALGCGAAAYLTWSLLNGFIGNTFSTLFAIINAVIVYIILLLFTKALSKDDIKLLPYSQKLLKILEKRGWIG